MVHIASEKRLAGSCTVPRREARQAGDRRFGLWTHHRNRDEAKAIARAEIQQLPEERAAGRGARVDEDHHLPGTRADIDGPQGRGIETQALAIDARGEPDRLIERL
jgi:hypothetical protein